MRFPAILALALALVGGFSRSSTAQTITSSDIQRLQDSVFDASRDLSQLRGRDASLASQLQNELDDARDDVTYLKVKLRRNEPVSRSDYDEVRSRIDSIRSRARGESLDRDYPR